MYCVLYSCLASPIGLLPSLILLLVNTFLCFYFFGNTTHQLPKYHLTWAGLQPLGSPWLVSCTVSVPWAGPPRAHRWHFVLYSPSAGSRLSGDWAAVKTGKKPDKTERAVAADAGQAVQRSVIKRKAAEPPHPRSASLSLQGPHSPDETVNIQPFNAECFHQLCRYTGKENA